MWSVSSITSLATFEGVLMPCSAPTATPRRVGPCIQLASSATTPSSFGRPPYPTLVSRGSSSTILTPAITASSVSPPPWMIRMAAAQHSMPPLLRLALEITMFLARGCATTAASSVRSEEHTSELQSLTNLVCRLLLEKKNIQVGERTREMTIHYKRTTY